MAIREFKLVIIGDPQTGKTSLLSSFCSEDSSFETGLVDIESKKDSKIVGFHLNDMLNEDLSNYRQLNKHLFPETHLIILCYDITNRNSYDNVLKKWYHGLKTKQYCPRTPVIVVGKLNIVQNLKQKLSMLNHFY
jgi:GTPase SAR1 family protein